MAGHHKNTKFNWLAAYNQQNSSKNFTSQNIQWNKKKKKTKSIFIAYITNNYYSKLQYRPLTSTYQSRNKKWILLAVNCRIRPYTRMQ